MTKESVMIAKGRIIKKLMEAQNTIDKLEKTIQQQVQEIKWYENMVSKMDGHLTNNGKEIIRREEERAELVFQLEQANQTIDSMRKAGIR